MDREMKMKQIADLVYDICDIMPPQKGFWHQFNMYIKWGKNGDVETKDCCIFGASVVLKEEPYIECDETSITLVRED